MSADSPPWTIYLAAVIPAAMVRRSGRASSKNCDGVPGSKKMARPPGRLRPCNGLCVMLLMGCHRSAPSPSGLASMKQAIPGSRTGPGVRAAPRSTRERMAWKSVTIPTREAQKTVLERAYVTAERLGLQWWCEDEGAPYQSIPPTGDGPGPCPGGGAQHQCHLAPLAQTRT